MRIADKKFFLQSTFVVPAGVTELFVHKVPHPQNKMWGCGLNHTVGWAYYEKINTNAAHGGPVSWGLNTNGQLGDSTVVNRSSPVLVAGAQFLSSLSYLNVMGVTTMANNSFFHGEFSTQAVGLNSSRQLLDNTTQNRSSPVQMTALSNSRRAHFFTRGAITTGYSVGETGLGYAWGSNTFGQLGDNTTTTQTTPTQIQGITSLTHIFPAENLAFGLRSDGSLWAWGQNSVGQLGVGDLVNRSTPTLVSSEPVWSKIVSPRPNTIYALRTDGSMWRWGASDFSSSTTPVAVAEAPAGVRFVDICATYNLIGNTETIFGLTEDGRIYGWGLNTDGVISDSGIGTTIMTPVLMASNPQIRSMDAGMSHHCYLLGDGTVWGRGTNTWGQLGDNTTTNRSSYVQALPSVLFGGVSQQTRFADRPSMMSQPFLISVTPGETLTIAPNTGQVSGTGGSIRLTGIGTTCTGIRLYWFE